MESEHTDIKKLTASRFRSVIFLFRLGGIPFCMKKVSTAYAIYMITVIFCACATFLGMLLDVYVHSNDLGHAMTTMRVLIPMVNILWINFYGRYVRTLAVFVAESQVLISLTNT
jgi:hypothetical protein